MCVCTFKPEVHICIRGYHGHACVSATHVLYAPGRPAQGYRSGGASRPRSVVTLDASERFHLSSSAELFAMFVFCAGVARKALLRLVVPASGAAWKRPQWIPGGPGRSQEVPAGRFLGSGPPFRKGLQLNDLTVFGCRLRQISHGSLSESQATMIH